MQRGDNVSTTKKIVIVAAVVLIILAAVSMYIKFGQALNEPASDLSTAGGNNAVIGAAPGADDISGEAMFNKEAAIEAAAETVIPELPSDETAVETTGTMPKEFIEAPYLIFGENPLDEQEGLLGELHDHDISAMTVKFDNINFAPGMYVRDIVDTSYWYTVLEHDIVEPDMSAFLRLDNDYWTNEEIRMVDTNSITNGDIVLWVHNYSTEPAEIRDCIIYKYQISYLGCWEQFSEHPSIEYKGLSWGSEHLMETTDSVTSVTTDRGTCTRYTYGSDSDCEVLLDFDDDKFIAVTVTFDKYFGPNFDRGGATGG